MLSKTWQLEQGMASVVLVLYSTLTLGTVSLIAGVGELSLERQVVQQVADAAALGISETRRGLIAGYPCENAEQIVKRFGFQLDTCRIVRFDASVEVSKSVFGFRVNASAKASL